MASTSDSSLDDSPVREVAKSRFEFIATILLDGLVILTAVVVRGLLLAVMRKITPADTETWATHQLERITDVGLVGAAAVFTVFDLTKRVLVGFKTLMRAARSTHQEP